MIASGLFHDLDLRSYQPPVLVSACLLGVPCRWHGRRTKKREQLIKRLNNKYVIVPVCPEQLGGLSTPRARDCLNGTGAQVLDEGLRITVPDTGEDLTNFYVNGAKYTLELARTIGAKRAYLKSRCDSCDHEGVTGEVLSRGGVTIVKVG